jgi:hypothetical protein
MGVYNTHKFLQQRTLLYSLCNGQCHGVNVQSSCDAHCRFTYISIRSPGGTGYSSAIYGMSHGFYDVADIAYMFSR